VLRGKYHLDRVLGVGGMAVVYAATHRNRQTFAVKVLHRELSLSQEVRTRFLREGYVANSVAHRGVVKVVDDDISEDGSAFLVMELLDGQSVEALSAQHGPRLSIPAVLALGHQLLYVLASAHGAGIVHRDIKPANLFLTRSGTLKVLDFGVARVRAPGIDGPGLTQTGSLLGTPAFMAPEQALGQSRAIDGQTDVWGAGATLFFLLSGAFVHARETAQAMLIDAATKPARSLAAVVPGAPLSVVRLIDRALAFEKQQRWESALAMGEAIAEAYLAEVGSKLSDEPLRALFEGELEVLSEASAPAHASAIQRKGEPKAAVPGSRSSAVRFTLAALALVAAVLFAYLALSKREAVVTRAPVAAPAREVELTAVQAPAAVPGPRSATPPTATIEPSASVPPPKARPVKPAAVAKTPKAAAPAVPVASPSPPAPQGNPLDMGLQ